MVTFVTELVNVLIEYVYTLHAENKYKGQKIQTLIKYTRLVYIHG